MIDSQYQVMDRVKRKNNKKKMQILKIKKKIQSKKMQNHIIKILLENKLLKKD